MVSIVINYCTNDERFIRKSLDVAMKLSNDIIVPISDHFYDGTLENIESIKKLASEYPTVNFQLYEWSNEYSSRYWHNISRVIGHSLCKGEWVLFLDADEIIDLEQFSSFINQPDFGKLDSYKICCYWYFRNPTYQSKSYESSPVLIRRDKVSINPHHPFAEREQLYEYFDGTKQGACTFNGMPLIHHYSWVRTKEQMLKKVTTWGHSKDTDWISLVEEEFSRPFNGTDFVHGYEYNIVENKFNL